MPPIGETLREARVRQKIDVRDVEDATKIRAKYLRALENEEFDRLPGSTYTRTFLRSYAEFLGLDPHLLVEEYRVQHEPPAIEEEAPQLAPTPAPRRRRGEASLRSPGGGPGGSRTVLVLGGVLAVVLLFLVIGLVAGGGDDGGEAPAPATDTAKDKGAKRQGRDAQAPTRDRVNLLVRPVETTYVCIDDGDGKRVFEGTLDSAETFRGDRLSVNLGNTSVELELNGEPVQVEESAEPIGFEFTPEGERELPVGERPCL